MTKIGPKITASLFERVSHSTAKSLVMLIVIALVSACGGGGGGGGESPAPVTPPAPTGTPSTPPTATTTVISGKATFQRVPQDPFTNGLRYNLTYSQPIRGAVVELVSATGTTLDSASTDNEGDFSFTTDANQQVSIRVKAQMKMTGGPSWDVSVVDNVNADALYVLASESFTTSGAAMTRNIEAGSGWQGGAYTEVRAAGPFAILDTVYESIQKVLEASPQAQFPELEVNWSINNRPTSGSFADGEIGSSLFRPSGGGREIYIVGAADADTDEYDPHVIAHEFTHFLHFHFGRSDSLGGSHSVGDRLDPRVAFGEGIATAFAVMILDEPNYIDSLGFEQAAGVNIDVEDNDLRNKGWYNEGSVQAVVYDIFDTPADLNDTLSMGFEPIYEALVGPLRDEVPLVTIHAYLDALKQNHPAIGNMIDEMAAVQNIRTVNSDAYGTGETNSAGRFDKVLPIYIDLPLDGTVVNVCTIAGPLAFGVRNKLSNRRFLKFNITDASPNQATTITATGPSDSDPDMVLHRDGVVQSSFNATNGSETLQRIFTEGEYVLEIYEYTNTTDTPYGDICFDVSAAPG